MKSLIYQFKIVLKSDEISIKSIQVFKLPTVILFIKVLCIITMIPKKEDRSIVVMEINLIF